MRHPPIGPAQIIVRRQRVFVSPKVQLIQHPAKLHRLDDKIKPADRTKCTAASQAPVRSSAISRHPRLVVQGSSLPTIQHHAPQFLDAGRGRFHGDSAHNHDVDKVVVSAEDAQVLQTGRLG